MKRLAVLSLMVMVVSTLMGLKVAILVGIDEYKTLGSLSNAGKDAQGLEEVLRRLGYTTKLLTGSVTPEEILWEIEYAAKNSRSGDQLIFFFSGHGAPGTTERERGLYTTYSDPDKGNSILTQERLREELEKFRGKKMVFLDACHQGPEDRSRAVRDDPGVERSLADSVDLLVTSSAANQVAKDRFQWGGKWIENGILGYFLKKALEGEADLEKDNKVTTMELERYLKGTPEYAGQKNGQNLLTYLEGEPRFTWFEFLTTGSGMPGAVRLETVPDGMVLVESGGFKMGSTGGDSDEKPVHEVEL
ncbi:MAG TPA: caspase family protein, partial [Thermotogota bacterium]|nr:caspase family protein [Thermotogota bacterium]